MTTAMTVSELEQWIKDLLDHIQRGFMVALGKDPAPMYMLDLIADWKAMEKAIYELLNTDNDLAYANCAFVLNSLRLKP